MGGEADGEKFWTRVAAKFWWHMNCGIGNMQDPCGHETVQNLDSESAFNQPCTKG